MLGLNGILIEKGVAPSHDGHLPEPPPLPPAPFEGTHRRTRRAWGLAASARGHPVPRLVFGATDARFGNMAYPRGGCQLVEAESK